MGRKAKYRKYLILILLLACFVLALYVVCNTKNSLTFRCNMWMLLIVKLLSFKRYNYPFYKCRENEQQM